MTIFMSGILSCTSKYSAMLTHIDVVITIIIINNHIIMNNINPATEEFRLK